MTKHQVQLVSPQSFYEGLSLAFRDPLLTEIEADFSGIRFLFPWQLALSACLKKLCANRYTLSFVWNAAKASQVDIASFAGQVGLFEGLPISYPQVAFNNDNYRSLYAIERADDSTLTDQLRGFIQTRSEPLPSPVARVLGELADNVVYHSGREDDSGWGFTQAQQSTSRFRIAFGDLGVGLYKTYQRSQSLRGRTPLEVLESSLNASECGTRRVDRNRGLGLARVCETIDALNGTMEIYSDGLRCRYSKGKKVTKILGFRTKGTLISIEIPLPS